MVLNLMLTKSLNWRLFGLTTGIFSQAVSFRRDIAAVTSIEYALLASLIAVVIAGICSALFGKLSTEYTEISNIFS